MHTYKRTEEREGELWFDIMRHDVSLKPFGSVCFQGFNMFNVIGCKVYLVFCSALLLLYIIPPITRLLTKINNLTQKLFFIFDGFKNEFIAFAKELKIKLLDSTVGSVSIATAYIAM